jgi:hypothetical protein
MSASIADHVGSEVELLPLPDFIVKVFDNLIDPVGQPILTI